METAVISALVGGLISWGLEQVPSIKAWLGNIPLWADALVLVALFFGIPLALAFGACQGLALPFAPATCPATRADVLAIVVNSTSALLASQVWHQYVNRPLNANMGGGAG